MSSRLRSWNSTKISFFAFQDIITSVSGILILVTLILATELDRPTSQAAHDADPELQRKLSETLRQQVGVDAQNQNLERLLLAAETAPAAQKLESDISRLRGQLAGEKQKNAQLAEQLAASQSAIEARDRTLGLTDLKAQIQRIFQEVESLAHQEAAVRKEMASLEQRVGSAQSKLLKLREREGKLWLIPDRTSTTKEPLLALISAAGVKIEQFDRPAEIREFAKSNARTEFDAYLTQAKPLDQYVVFLVRPSGIALFGSLVKMAREKGFEVGFDALEEDKDVYFATPPIPDETAPPPRRTASQYQPGTGGYSDPRGGAGEVGASGSGPGQRNENRGSGSAAQYASPSGSDGGSGASSGSGNGRGSAAGRGKTSGTGEGNGPGAAPGKMDGAATAGSSKADASQREVGKAGEIRAGGTNNASDNARAAATNSFTSADPKKRPPAPAAKPAPPSSPKPRSWWQRLLAWVASWFK